MFELHYCVAKKKVKKVVDIVKVFKWYSNVHTYSHTNNTMLAVEMINRDIMLWHDGREKSNLAYLNKHDFMFEKI